MIKELLFKHYVFFQDGGGNYNGKEQFLSSSSTLTINVIDAQDTPPSFIGTPYFGYVYEVSKPVSMKISTTDFILYEFKILLVILTAVHYTIIL